MNSPPLSCGRKPWREGFRHQNRELNLSGKPRLNGKINTKLSILQVWKELKKEIHDGLFAFFNDVRGINSLETYKNIFSCFKNWNVLREQKYFS